MPGTRKLGRKTAHRMLMLRGLVTYLLENGKIETTLTRAKEVSALADQMITLGKQASAAEAKGDRAAALAYRRQLTAFITKDTVVKKTVSQLAEDYEGRNGGYTQVYKLGPRRGDGAEMALIRLIPVVAAPAATEAPAAAPKKATRKKKAAAPVEEAAAPVEETVPAAEETPVVEETAEAEAPAATEETAE